MLLTVCLEAFLNSVSPVRYNCMVLDLVLTDHGQPQPYLTSSSITDEECGVEFCQENLTNPGCKHQMSGVDLYFILSAVQ